MFCSHIILLLFVDNPLIINIRVFKLRAVQCINWLRLLVKNSIFRTKDRKWGLAGPKRSRALKNPFGRGGQPTFHQCLTQIKNKERTFVAGVQLY